ncbi:MAG: phytoene dehydrogenase [Rhodospirillaceae bacterium]|nr:phytoene dehydrogenase [Rhodospirillaceae bacterium]|tara:strand:+ start:264 stop:1721 length:1458 start_codon:yes stop_codon:yes gene_type:complete
MPDELLVIGGGLGGIASALRAKAAGYSVTLVERLSNLGGRAQVLTFGGYKHDTGPTVITAPFLFDELFSLFSEKRSDKIEFVSLKPWYRFYFQDGSQFNYGGSNINILEEIKRFAPDDLNGYQQLVAHSKKLYDVAYTKLGDIPFNNLSTLIKAAPDMLRLRADLSVWKFVGRYIKNSQLRRALSIQPLLLGGNPLDTTCIYSLIHYLERAHGVHFAMGGMGNLISELEALMLRQNITILKNTTVEKIKTEKKSIKSVITNKGDEISAAQFIYNGDPLFLYQKLLDPTSIQIKIKRHHKRSMGLFVIFFGTKKTYDDIPHHSIWMGPRFEQHLTEIFDKKILPDDFSLYLHRPTATDASFAPTGHDSFYVLAPVPNLTANINWEVEGPKLEKKIISALSKTIIPDLKKNISETHIMTPVDFAKNYLSIDGAGFSISPSFRQSAWFRFHNISEGYNNLYLAGAGTHPGAGIPGVLSSAKVVEKLIT